VSGDPSGMCRPLSDNATKIKQLVERAREFGQAWQHKRWPRIAYSLSDTYGARPSDIQEWLDTARRASKATEVTDWRLLRVEQCGRLAIVIDEEISRDRENGDHILRCGSDVRRPFR